MSDNSNIEWTDATWNPVRGCVNVSPGCAHCYAETFAERFRGVKGHPYEQGFDLRLVPEKLTEPLSWKTPRRVFVNSMSDLFQDGVPDGYIDRVFAVMSLCERHTFQILTKRPDRMRAYVTSRPRDPVKPDQAVILTERGELDQHYSVPWPLNNAWIGVSVENRLWKSRVDILRNTPAAVRFLSIEPLLEDVGVLDLHRIHWVIVGGESGSGARPFNCEWARSIVAQCRTADVPCFVKQLGSKPFEPYSDGTPFVELHLKSKKGGDMAEWPEDLRVREFPEPVTCH